MSSASSFSNDGGSIVPTRRLALGAKPNVSLHIDNFFSSKVYTSSSPVSGYATIQTAKDVRFDNIQILLLGTTRTRVDGVSSPHTTSHTFLKLEMPIPETTYPVPRVFEAGRAYNIPFNFVIPSQLTINACNHRLTTEAVRDHHLCLPPSMGEWGKDDFAPEMAKVEYSLKARVYRDEELPERRIKLAEASQAIRVLPAYTEEAPLNVTKRDKQYNFSKSKTLRKSILSAKTGKVCLYSAQPGAAMLSPDGHLSASTTLQANLRFDPATIESRPPKVVSVSAKITATTYYGAGAINIYPNMGDWSRSYGAEGRGSYSTTMSLFSKPLENIRWTQLLKGQGRRDSGYSSDASDSDQEDDPLVQPTTTGGSSSGGHREASRKSDEKKGVPIFHETSLQIPFRLPTDKKMFIPTFHSCIASRAYFLALTVSLSSSGTSSTLTVHLPLQIGVDATESLADPTGLPSFEAALQEAEVDEYLRPRVLSVPNVEYQQQSVLPGYDGMLRR